MSFARWQATIVDDAGNVVPNATVTVRREIGGLPLQTLYSDRAGSVPLSNPTAADSEGFVFFYCAGGSYQIVATSGAFSRTWRHVAIGTGAEYDIEDLIIGLSWQGEWTTATLYSALAGVIHEGTAYICIQDHTSSATDEPGVGASWESYWEVLVERGLDDPIWTFDSTTASADPGTGEFRLNNATLSSVTALYISESSADSGNPSFATWLQLMDDSLDLLRRAILIIRNVRDRSQFAMYYVNAAITDNGAWDTINLTHIASNGGPFVAGDDYAVSFAQRPDPATGTAWAYATTTAMADPGAGNFRLNNATLASVTAIALDDQSVLAATDISAWFNTWDDSTSFRKGFVTIRQNNAPGTFAVYRIDSLTDNSGWSQLTVTHVASAGTFTSTARFTFEFSRNGDRGDPAGLKWLFDNSTSMADPGSGDFRLNNASPASATAMAISDNIGETGNPSAEAWLLTWDDSTSTVNGYLTLKDSLNPQVFAVYAVGAVTNNTGWCEVALTYIAGSGSFTNASPVSIDFVRTGDKGDTGAAAIDFSTLVTIDAVATDDWLVVGDVSDDTPTPDETKRVAVSQFLSDRLDPVYAKITRGYNQRDADTTYILVLSDAGKLVVQNNGSANNIQVPPNTDVAFPLYTQIDVASIGVGQTTIQAGSGVTIVSEDSKLKLSKRYSAGTIVKIATDTWLLTGSIAA